MIYLTGDIHSNPIERFSFKVNPELRNLTENDWMIVLGDCGLPWYNPDLGFFDYWTQPGAEKGEHYKLAWLNSRPWKTLFLRGNHDNIDLINMMPHTEVGQAKVRQTCYQDKIYENIFYIDEPQFMFLEGQKILFVPGAESHDADYIFEYDDPATKEKIKAINKKFIETGEDTFYRVNHFSYWEDEGVDPLKVHNLILDTPVDVDYVFTHAPRAALRNQWKFPNKPAREYPAPSERILEHEVARWVKYKLWVHGHFHHHIELPNIYSLGIYHEIYSLETLEQIKKSFDLEIKYQKEMFSASRRKSETRLASQH